MVNDLKETEDSPRHSLKSLEEGTEEQENKTKNLLMKRTSLRLIRRSLEKKNRRYTTGLTKSLTGSTLFKLKVCKEELPKVEISKSSDSFLSSEDTNNEIDRIDFNEGVFRRDDCSRNIGTKLKHPGEFRNQNPILRCFRERSDSSENALANYIHYIFDMSICTFFIMNLAIFISAIIIFSCLIYGYIIVLPYCVSPPGAKFSTAFGLSWTTFTTVGYGHTYPSVLEGTPCRFLDVLTLVEAFFGIIFVSFIGATFFAKVIRVQSQADVIFTDSMPVLYNQGVKNTPCIGGSVRNVMSNQCPRLQFRIVNKRYDRKGGEIINATLNCVSITTSNTNSVNMNSKFFDEANFTEVSYSFSNLDITSPSHPFFRRVWNVQHVLNEHSPLLQREVRAQIKRNNGCWPDHLKTYQEVSDSIEFEQIVVNFSGTSNASNSIVHTQKIYERSDLIFGYEFVDIVYRDERQNKLMMDLSMVNNATEQFGGGGEPL